MTNETTGKKERKLTPGQIVALVLVVLVLVGVTVAAFPFISSLTKPENLESFKNTLRSFGAGGFFIILGLQVLQVVVAVLPGEPIELLAGAMFGTWGGLFTCYLGLLIGTGGIFLAVKKFGYPLLTKFVSEEQLKSYKFLNNTTRLETLIFLLFFIPGTPKDVLTYVAGITPISLGRFLFLSLFARIPSVISSTFVGSSFIEGNVLTSVLVFAGVGVVGIAGILIHKHFIAKLQKEE
ncbi:TVP38/TMEM64 family protein [Zongyangia hominis]|uniref:TVP38/TMEM64 family membrane protein n=1 Tax=Zongyangia hominis TaxID=2763677 RepID=A0A926EF60_9FIRM|nr:VTT domain-containing protein [Zongyangia hominis]MBC8570951.1 TVP38/TMEM64 family protein [Zongyangia hominis]